MSELQELTQRVEAFIAKVKQARKVEKDVDRLAGWLDQLDQEAEAYQKLPWWKWDRWKKGFRLLFKGQSKERRELNKKFRRWEGQRARTQEAWEDAEHMAESLSEAATRNEKRERARQWYDALQIIEAGKEKVRDSSLQEVNLVIYDLSGRKNSLEDTLSESRVDFDSFGSVQLITAFPESLPADPRKIETLEIRRRYFDLFEELDRCVEASSPDKHTLLVETGSALVKPLDLPANWRDYPILIPRLMEIEELKPRPVLGRDEWQRKALFPMTAPVILVRNEFAQSVPHLFRDHMHLAFWRLLLSQVEEDSGRIIQLEPVSCLVRGWDYQLSEVSRLWTKQYRPELLSELRDPKEEWDILLHDLIGRVATAHIGLFEKQAAYLAATGVTRVIR